MNKTSIEYLDYTWSPIAMRCERVSTGEYQQQELARLFSVAFQTISKIVRGERRQAQGGPTDSNDHRYINSERDPQTGRFVGKKDSGRLLDGREWNQMPVPQGT